MAAQTALPQDDPRMIAWNAYVKTEAFANSQKWAVKAAYDDGRIISPEMREQNVTGSLWAAFIAGFESANK